MRVSLIIPIYNAEEHIDRCLEYISKQERLPEEIILIDNSSIDHSVNKISSFIKSNRNLNVILLHETNKGPGAARNKGLQSATGGIIVFTDSDCFPRKDWIKNILAVYENNEIDAIGGTTYIFEPRTISEKIQAIDLCTPKEMPAIVASNKDEFLLGRVIVTFNGSYKKKVLDAIGSFDESFSIAGEDVDLSIRALENGFKLLIRHPEIVVWHMPRKSLSLYAKRTFQYRAALPVLFKKHFKNTAFIELPRNGFKKFPFFAPLLITKESEIVIFFIILILIFYKYFSTILLISITVLYLRFLKGILTRSKSGKINVSLSEAFIMAVYDIFKKIVSECGRVYGSVKSRVIYI